MKRTSRGFTLIELLVAVSLAAVLVTVLAILFARTTSTVMAGEARMAVAEDGRHALDQVAIDLDGAIPSSAGSQRFIVVDGPGSAVPGPDVSEAQDALALVTSTTVPDGAGGRVTTMALVELYLQPESDTELSIAGANPNAIRSGRPMKALHRRVWRIAKDTGLAAVKAPIPMNTAVATAAGLQLVSDDVLHQYVMSMNLEIFEGGKWLEVHDKGSILLKAMPIGDVSGDPGMPRKLRVSMRVIEGSGESCERLFQREMWIPAE
ncbi:MAG: type II secretion system GspH family protein [Planctomycetes bacterium]|nr:type II secretion system GspH family protein [Planctomycetota bacterium]